jgi:hypothetical protein
MGLVKVNIKELVADQVLDSWFSLMEDESMEDRPRKKGGKEKDEKEKEKEDCTPKPVGTIRLCLKFLEELVLPGVEYNDLLVLLIGDPSLRLVQAFSKTVTPDDLEELSRVLCRVFDAKGGSSILLDSLTGKEIADTSE